MSACVLVAGSAALAIERDRDQEIYYLTAGGGSYLAVGSEPLIRRRYAEELEKRKPPMNAPTQPPMDIGKRVDQYVKLRDKIKEMNDAHKTVMKPYVEALERLNGVLLHHLNTVGAENVRTEAGTVYKTEQKSVTISDGGEFRRFVIGGELWDLLDWKANKTAVETFLQENSALPPGVNYSSAFVVGVRRS